MKARKLFFGAAIAFSLLASLAFKPAKMYQMGSIIDPLYPPACIEGVPVDDQCSVFNHGAQCTFLWDTTYEPVYEERSHGSSPGSCVVPMFYPW